MQRLWVRWIALVLFVAVLGTVFVNLGQWQLRRLAERRERNAVITTNEAAPVVDAATLFGRGAIGGAEQWRRVTATGTFDPDHQYVVRFRSDADDHSGYEIVTPLRTTAGFTVLVDRGFLPLDPGEQIPTTAPAPPTGVVTVVGHVRADERGGSGAATPNGGQVRVVSSVAIGATLPYPIVDGYLGALSVDPPQDAAFRPVGTPEISDGPHFWYAVQWFMFTGIAVFGIVVFVRGDLRERRERRTAAAAGPGSSDRDGSGPAGSDPDGPAGSDPAGPAATTRSALTGSGDGPAAH